VNYLLDTNICIYLIKKRPLQVLERFRAHSVGEVGISSITVAELEYGVQKSQYREQNRRALAQFLIPLAIVAYDERAAAAYGHVRAALEAKGQPIGAMDMLIASHALGLNVTLVTNNLREFSRIPDLEVANWAAA
jgi:tRNA(fMet)-specific endonuclease VapC